MFGKHVMKIDFVIEAKENVLLKMAFLKSEQISEGSFF